MIIKPRKRSNQPKLVEYGDQDSIDLISYSGLEEQSSHMILDDYFIRTLFISGYPYIAHSGWLNSLINFNSDIDVSYHLEVVDASLSLPKLNRKITELESTKRALIKNGQLLGPEVTDPLQSATDLRNKIMRGQEKLFQISIYMCIRATTLEELNKITKILESTMAARLFYTKVALFQQAEALQSVLPRGEDLIMQRRNLDSSSAALTFPFFLQS